MPKTERGPFNESERHTSSDNRSDQDRMVTREEREDLIADANAFKKRHEKTFRILSEGDG